MRYFLTFLLALTFFAGAAQTGHYFLSHHTLPDERIDPVAFDMVQDANGILYFATRSGILMFDGKRWEVVKAGSIYALTINDRGEIFWAGSRGCGQLIEQKDGTRQAQLLSENDQLDFYNALSINDKTYFLNGNAVYAYTSGGVFSRISSENQEGSFNTLFELFGEALVSTFANETYRLEENGLTLYRLPFPREVIFSSRFESNYLAGTADNHLFICSADNNKCRKIPLSTQEYFDASVIVSGTWINNDLVALGTLRGGVVFLNPHLGNVEQIINYTTGLPDNETFSIARDYQGNLWVSHDYGFTRITPSIPLRSFNHYEGLQGNVLCAISYNNEAYVGTSLGLFKLTREEIYDEIVFFEEAPLVKQVKDAEVAGTQEKETVVEEKKKRGFLQFLRGNRNKVREPETGNNGTATTTAENISELDLNRDKTQATKIRKTARILSASQYAFKRVDGIKAKVTHLTQTGNTLIAAGLSGVFQVNNLKATSLLQDPVKHIFSSDADNLIATTQSDRVIWLRHSLNRWDILPLIDNMNEPISFGFSNGTGELWLCGLERMHRVTISGKTVEGIQVLEFPNPDFSRTVGTYYEDQAVFVNAEGFYRFDRGKSSIVPMDSLPSPRKYFAVAGNLWYHDTHSWQVYGKTSFTHLLNQVKDIRSVIPAESDEMLWVVAGSKELYKVSSSAQEVFASPFPPFLKYASQADVKLPLQRRLVIDQEGGPLVFEVARPDYTENHPTEYRYLLKGMHDQWSEWSVDHDRITFSYLPQGNFVLHVQSRDMGGNIMEITPASFVVRPPYWKTSWFYAMEFAFFSLLVLLSFKLSVKYRIVSRLLLLLTIILLIELVQTIIGYSLFTDSSPLMDFIIQVVVALIILPIEGFLRKYINHSLGSGSRLYEVISEMDKQEKGKK